MDDSGFLRTPDRPVKLLGTCVSYLRSVKTLIGARGFDFLGGSATPISHMLVRKWMWHGQIGLLRESLEAHHLSMKLSIPQVFFSNERLLSSHLELPYIYLSVV